MQGNLLNLGEHKALKTRLDCSMGGRDGYKQRRGTRAHGGEQERERRVRAGQLVASIGSCIDVLTCRSCCLCRRHQQLAKRPSPCPRCTAGHRKVSTTFLTSQVKVTTICQKRCVLVPSSLSLSATETRRARMQVHIERTLKLALLLGQSAVESEAGVYLRMLATQYKAATGSKDTGLELEPFGTRAEWMHEAARGLAKMEGSVCDCQRCKGVG